MTPDDPASLIECIDEIRRDPSRYQRGRGHVVRFFDRTALADEMLDTLRRFGPTEPVEARPTRKAA
jgi:hypothetical protein